MPEKTAYRIVEKTPHGQYKTLFHGCNGSRVLPVGVWLKSEQKKVRDGSGGTYYTSGFHLIESLKECQNFMKRKFTAPRNLVIVKCLISGETWPKSHSPSNIILCKYMKILEEA